MNGLLLIDKPAGWTSFDVVAKVRSVLCAASSKQQTENSGKKLVSNSSLLVSYLPKVKVGHTGTLDPLATGLLVLVIGNYTKRAGEFSKLDKTYEVTIKLGETSTTGDEEGEKTAVSPIKPSLDNVEAALSSFIGEIEQIPPQFSAIKVGGQRAYKLARKGQKIELEPRKVTIYNLTPGHSTVQGSTLYSRGYGYPEVKFTAEVSSGTYIRSLVEDMGVKLGTGAYMSALRRTKVGSFDVKNALKAEDLTTEKIQANLLTS